MDLAGRSCMCLSSKAKLSESWKEAWQTVGPILMTQLRCQLTQVYDKLKFKQSEDNLCSSSCRQMLPISSCASLGHNPPSPTPDLPLPQLLPIYVENGPAVSQPELILQIKNRMWHSSELTGWTEALWKASHPPCQLEENKESPPTPGACTGL